MSSSISNSSELSALPSERGSDETQDGWLDRERRVAVRACVVVPLLALAAWPFIANWLLYVLYLKLPEGGFHWSRMFESKPAMVVCIFLTGLPLVWLCALECECRFRFLRTTRIPLSALASLIGVAAFCLILQTPRARWFFVEWAVPRTPNPSFERNTLFWEQRNFKQARGRDDSGMRIGLIGSSQVFAGFDAALLCSELHAELVEKDCLAGFGPMNYPLLINRIDERGFDCVVCWISEFDMFREDELPTNRLRWAANPAGLRRLWSAMRAADRWRNRSELADMGLASYSSVWRMREHFQRVLLKYWWNVAWPTEDKFASEGTVLAKSGALDTAKANMRRNVRRTRLLDANFNCFRMFAEHFVKNQVPLVVLEGQSHPEVMTVYPADFRTETRRRMSEMASEMGFEYEPQTKLPQFDAADFSDGYHLNDRAREEMTLALARLLRKLPAAAAASESIEQQQMERP